MRTLREDKEAELRQLLNSNGGPQRIRELYEEVTGTKVPQVGYVNALIPAILDRHVENAEAAIMLKDHLPAPEQIPSLSPQAVGERLLLFFEEVILKRQQRTAIKRDYIGGTFPVRDYPQQLRTPITKVLLEGWDWLVNQGMIVKEGNLRVHHGFLFMTSRRIATAGLVALLLASNGLAEEPLKSGPPVGARNNRGGFYPQFVAGPGTGERRCPV